ncbi:hypothetical protein L1N85_26875 [Paenibacillus alkaliterrae]|uniref:hypothetical protein n=1 Tax=Paenibacillus alkaliterrae TaxID=320909 RepID=UPI001F2EA3FD|nr:hypothetical protein [Paenibacillus alkaliterrae]MCF2941943.1 hypothetical protein [Paenibacillus alkaliterrae]
MRRYLLVFTPLVALLFVISINSIVAASEQEEAFPNTLPPASTVEEQVKWKDQFKDWAEKKGHVKHFAGEKTKGSAITIAGRSVKLPGDAFVKAYVVDDERLELSEETATNLPFYAIQRGNSTIMIAEHTGVVVNLVLDEADKKPFEFLKGDVKGYLKGVAKDE